MSGNSLTASCALREIKENRRRCYLMAREGKSSMTVSK